VAMADTVTRLFYWNCIWILIRTTPIDLRIHLWLDLYDIVPSFVLQISQYTKEKIMYRLSRELAGYLLKHTKDAQLPELTMNNVHPYKPQNTKAIGLIEPHYSLGSELDWVVECDYKIPQLQYQPAVDGCWLYRREELGIPVEPVKIPKAALDPNVKDPEEILDITDCCIMLPTSVEKLTCPSINTLDQLLKKEPTIKECLTEPKA